MPWGLGATTHPSSPPGLSTQQLLRSFVCTWAWAPGGAGAVPGVYALWHLRAEHGGGIPSLSWQCHGTLRGHLGGASLTEHFECELQSLLATSLLGVFPHGKGRLT